MHDCILVEGNGRTRLMKIEEGRQEITIANPGSGHYFGFRVREYSIEKEGHLKIYLIASEDPQDPNDVAHFVNELSPIPISDPSV